MAFKHYFYDSQIRKYLLQFADLMSGLRVRTGARANGESIFVTVPIKFASQDRMTHLLSASHGSGDPDTIDRLNISIPIMSFEMINLSPKPESRRHPGVIDRRTYVSIEDAIESVDATDMSTKIRKKVRAYPVPYLLSVDLHLYASNTDQHLQMLEQLLMIFNPDITIQKSDGPWDWGALTKVTLIDIALEEQIPVGTDERIIQSTLSFEIPIWISGPMKEVKGTGYVTGIRHVIRNAEQYTGDLDDLLIGSNIGSIPAGITSTGISIDIISDPADSVVDVTEDENGVQSVSNLPPKTDYNV